MVMLLCQYFHIRVEYAHHLYTLFEPYWIHLRSLCVPNNCAFVVDTSKLGDPGDTKCDDCGAWRQTKTATTHLNITFSDDGHVDSVKCCSNIRKQNHYILVRRHFTCKSSTDLSRHISVLYDPSGNPSPCQFIQYRFSGRQHFVDVKPHGNSKQGARPYKRTCPSTIKDLENEVKLHPPKRAVFKVDQRRGGILNVSCTEDLPRNALQASRIRHKKIFSQSHPYINHRLCSLLPQATQAV